MAIHDVCEGVRFAVDAGDVAVAEREDRVLGHELGQGVLTAEASIDAAQDPTGHAVGDRDDMAVWLGWQAVEPSLSAVHDAFEGLAIWRTEIPAAAYECRSSFGFDLGPQPAIPISNGDLNEPQVGVKVVDAQGICNDSRGGLSATQWADDDLPLGGVRDQTRQEAAHGPGLANAKLG